MLKTFRLCSCGFISWHPLRWCPRCGQVLEIKTAQEGEYKRLLMEFVDKTHWQWSEIKFDPKTGETWPFKK